MLGDKGPAMANNKWLIYCNANKGNYDRHITRFAGIQRMAEYGLFKNITHND